MSTHIYVVRINNHQVAATFTLPIGQALARNFAKRRKNVRLFKIPVHGHISTALPRPIGERHTKGAT